MNLKAILASLVVSVLACHSSNAQVVWSDEFNGDHIDASTWIHEVGGHGFGNGQLEFNTARRANSYVDNGSLVIEARREAYEGNAFTSARMTTQGRFAFQYGTLEARIKLPDTANGIWPAFWMLGNNFPAIPWPKSGEIDILEIGGKDGIAEGLQHRKINCAIHFADADDKKASQVSWYDAPVDLHLDYHKYKISWTPQRLTFYLDDVEYGSFDITGDHLREFHQPCFLILNIAVGSWDSSYTGITRPDAVTAPLPAKMYVDWIRLTRNEQTKLQLGSKEPETGKFGVFTETPATQNRLVIADEVDSEFPYGKEAALLSWNNMVGKKPSSASDGDRSWSFEIAAGKWFGMGVLAPPFRNMANYSDGTLHFDIKTDSTARMRVGIKSSRGGESFLPLGDETNEFGFPRDGNWHPVQIPLNRFANIDFQTIHQPFMIAGDPPSHDFNLSFDNIWWEPSEDRPRPHGGNFGIFTDNPTHKSAGAFQLGVNGDFFVWEKTLIEGQSEPFEGSSSKQLQSAPGMRWFGAAFTPNIKHDFTALRHAGTRLHFAMKSRSSARFRIGMKSGNMDGIGQGWISFDPDNDPYGFARDGQWHVVEIPLSEFDEVDFAQVSQLFQILSIDGPISDIELDDICIVQP